ncbi:MAG TPA: hypothetical protein PK253_02580 [Spirochaetota bacterium]|nr:hypothetical protein [Spirochaetota bacterium]
MKRKYLTITVIFLLAAVMCIAPSVLMADIHGNEHISASGYHLNLINIRNTNGKFYAYIVLLFNENPHFVNLIQEGTVSLKEMQKEGFHVVAYRNYLKSLNNQQYKKFADLMFDVYLYPEKFNRRKLKTIEKKLERKNIILRFSRSSRRQSEKIILDYCIFGKKELLSIAHPLFQKKEKIYNIQPFIYYDEFSTSNSTFYFDMVYINPEEVYNDLVIAKRVMMGKNVDSMFFVGSRVTEDIKYCLRRAFPNILSIKREIWKMFVVHELTHKILNNHYNYYDQISGEELALCSTIYLNPYLGLSVLYSYLDYSVTNPHRNAALNIIRYIAEVSDKENLVEYQSLLKYMPAGMLTKFAKDRFDILLRNLNR